MEREKQKLYWQEHSGTPTVEAMMLDSKAAEIDKLERPEVLATLGPVKGRRVLELGAGIGRFTGELAKAAAHVTACDFMEASIRENRRIHGVLPNVDFLVADVTELELGPGSYDVVFSNWLLMYLSDAEVLELARNMLTWLTDGGTLFFRESCFRQSGDKARAENPTHYRSPRDYFALFDQAVSNQEDGRTAFLELVLCKCVDTYVQVKRNQNQICWRWKKVSTAEPHQPSFRQLLDTQQYTEPGISMYEAMYGEGFVSVGGAAMTRQLAERLRLRAGQQVLDVGCGVGGAAFYISSTYDVHVHGIDLSVNMILRALERSSCRKGNVAFEVADVMTREFPEASFDCIYSRDALLHIADKQALIARLFKWLKPGGQLLITDYCCGVGSEELQAYTDQRKYSLATLQQYRDMLSGCGFTVVEARDMTAQFVSCLEQELQGGEAAQTQLAATLGQQDVAGCLASWRAKLGRAQRKEQLWACLTAQKPVAAMA